MKTRFILTENSVDFLFNFLNNEKYKHTSMTGDPYSNDIIKQDVQINLLKDTKECVALSSLELNVEAKTYTITTKFYTGSDELLEVIKSLKIDKDI